MVKCPSVFRENIVAAIRLCRNYFSENATQEMLDEWMPMFCPTSKSLARAINYMEIFLPTFDVPPEKSYKVMAVGSVRIMRSHAP